MPKLFVWVIMGWWWIIITIVVLFLVLAFWPVSCINAPPKSQGKSGPPG